MCFPRSYSFHFCHDNNINIHLYWKEDEGGMWACGDDDDDDDDDDDGRRKKRWENSLHYNVYFWCYHKNCFTRRRADMCVCLCVHMAAALCIVEWLAVKDFKSLFTQMLTSCDIDNKSFHLFKGFSYTLSKENLFKENFTSLHVHFWLEFKHS